MVEREGSHWEWEPGGWADSRDSRALSAGEALQSLEGRDVTTVTSQTIGPAKAGTAAHRVSPQNSAGNECEICLCMFLWTLFMIIFFFNFRSFKAWHSLVQQKKKCRENNAAFLKTKLQKSWKTWRYKREVLCENSNYH